MLLCVILISFTNQISAQSFTKGEFTYEIISAVDKTLRVTDFNQTSTNSYVSNRLIRIPSGVGVNGDYFTVTEISYLFSSLDKNIKTLIIPSTITKVGSSFYPYFANEVYLLTPTPPEGYNAFRGVKNLYIIGGSDFPFGTEMVSVINGLDKTYDGNSASFTFFSNMIGKNVTIAEPYKSSYASNAGVYKTKFRYEFKLDNNNNVPGYSDYVTYDPTITCYKEIDYTISPKELIVVSDDLRCEYGENIESISCSSVSGFVNNESLETLGAQITFDSQYYPGKPVGIYPIIANINNSNYTCTTEATITVTQAPLSITANNSTRLYGDSNPSFSFSYNGFKLSDDASNSFTQSPRAVCSANNRSDVGEYEIGVEGGVSKNYSIVEYNSGVLTITQAPLTLKANDASRLYFEQNPTFTFSLTGLRNSDTQSCLIDQPQFSCSATLESDCGQYEIMPSGAIAKNYEISYMPGAMSVLQASALLTPKSISREYGESNPVLTFEAIGLKGEQSIDNIFDEYPSLTTSAIESSNVGEYPITISGGTSKNYNFTYRQGALTVTQAPLSITANNSTRLYGDSNPSFSFSYNGFKLSDDASNSFTQSPRAVCSANNRSDVGEYEIGVEGGVSKNYSIVEYNSGVLTITQAPLTLKANDASRLYFEQNPTFTFSLTGLRNSDTQSCLIDQPQFSCSATLESDCGQYEIMPSGAIAKNYEISYMPGALNVNKRSLTASVGNYSRKYNEDNPEFAVTYSGFINSENESVLQSSTLVQTDADKNSNVGIYTLHPYGGSATNYSIDRYVDGKLTIEKANQTIDWNQDLSNVEINSQIELTALASSDLPIVYELAPNNVADLYAVGDKFYLDCYGNGSVVIRATQSGNTNYNAAIKVSKTLTVGNGGGSGDDAQIFVNVETAGTLSSLISPSKKYQIKNLKVSGYLNGTDIAYLRDMAGADTNGNSTNGALESLDISQATIVTGGSYYYSYYGTSNYIISDYIFYNCDKLIKLHLPSNSVKIGNYSFAGCSKLASVTLPKQISVIGDYAFKGCISIANITLPENLTKIGNGAFADCSLLSGLNIPYAVNQIGDNVVEGCTKITAINVDSDNTEFMSIDGVLFNNSISELYIYPVAKSAKTYTIPETVTRLRNKSFMSASKIVKIIMPSGLISIGSDAFIGCVSLAELVVKAITPPTCENDCFESVSKSRCQLYVPKGCYNYYWVAPVWADFKKLSEIDETGVESIYDDNGVTISVVNDELIINGAKENSILYVVEPTGRVIYQGLERSLRLAKNVIYIISIENHTKKVVL